MTLFVFRDFSRFSEECCVRVPWKKRVTFRPSVHWTIDVFVTLTRLTAKKALKSQKKTENKGYYLCFFHFSSENKGYYLCFFHFSVDMDRKIEVCQIVPFWFCESCGLARCALPHVQPLLYSLTLLSTLFGKNDWSRLLPRGADSIWCVWTRTMN